MNKLTMVAAAAALTVGAMAQSGLPTRNQQELAPTCAGCAGEARIIGADGLPTQWNFTYRVLAIDQVSARHRFTLDYRVTPNFYVGIERAGSDDQPDPWPAIGDDFTGYFRESDGDSPILPRASWFITPEGENTPSLTLGFTSDRLSTPRGQALFITAGKSFLDGKIQPFVSTKYNTPDGRVVFPFGANWRPVDELMIQAINDGDYTHVLFTNLNGTNVTPSLVWARTQYWGAQVAVGF